jgi:hypothetical protein
MPPPVPPAATDLSQGPAEVDAKMAEANVTDEQIQKSNEPGFKSALDARDAAKEHAATAPADYRKTEQGVLQKAQAGAVAAEATGLQGMQGARGKAMAQALGHKQGAKAADEAKRAKVASDIQSIYEKTKADVTKTLGELDGKVDTAFTQGEGAARTRFEDSVGAKMDAYKDDRYSGLLGKGRWLKDKLLGMPSEVNRFYAEGRTQYLADMDAVISKVADVVGAGLTGARARIAQGKAEVAKYVAQLPQDLQKVGKEAEEKLSGQFEQLTADVDSKQSELVDTLAHKYVEARDALDSRIEEMKAANRGLVDKALDAVVGVVKTILQLKNLLLGVLAKAADVIGDIITDPIGFLGKLIDGVKAGLSRFVGNIAGHLKEGLMGWLFGALGSAGIELPKTFDFKGILGLVLQVLGLTYRSIRARVVKLVGEPIVARLEQTVDVFKTLLVEGPAGLFKWIMEKLGDLEDLVLGQIKTFIIEKVIKAGITWLIAFLNPAAAFIKACKAIYDIVMFLIERGSEIMDFVRSILDSVGAIAKGAIGIVAEKVESSLAKALPLAISFLAGLLGLGGISEKIRGIIQKVQAPINKAVDFVVMGALKGAKKLFGGALGWAKGKYEKGKAWVKGKATAAKDWAKGKAQGLKDRLTGGPAEEAGGADEAVPAGRVAETSVDVAPDEQHTVYAEVDHSGHVQIGMASTPQLVTELIAYFQGRVPMLPVSAAGLPELPKGAVATDQPRMQAQAALQRILKQESKVRGWFQNGLDLHRKALHRTASGVPGPFVPAPELTSALNKLGGEIKGFLRFFHVYDRPDFERVPHESSSGQKLSARITVLHEPGGTVLPTDQAGKLKALHPTVKGAPALPGSPEYLAPDPDLAAATTGAVLPGGAQRPRGVIHSDVQGQPAPAQGQAPVEREVVVRTWAIGGRPDKGSNASHTENQFQLWFAAQGDDFFRRITAIELRSGFSPCGDCTRLLVGIAHLIDDKRPPGSPGVPKVLFWDTLYGKEEEGKEPGPAAATFQRHIQSLGAAGWIVHGPPPST